MNFNDILQKASKNAKGVSETLNKLDSEVHRERKDKAKSLVDSERQARLDAARKKKEQSRREEEERRAQFTIPKKKDDDKTVDKNKIAEFLAKRNEEKRISDKKKQEEKERLIQLRLTHHGGKASKKMGKHFGMDALDIQIRYGKDHELVEKLQKQKWREEEEQERMADEYRSGVYKAMVHKNKVMSKIDPKEKRAPHRVATSKSNSLAGLSSRHVNSRDHFSPPPEPKKKEKEQKEKEVSKKRPPPAPVDFSSLMKTAEKISRGEDVPPTAFRKEQPVTQNRKEQSVTQNRKEQFTAPSNKISKPNGVDKRRDNLPTMKDSRSLKRPIVNERENLKNRDRDRGRERERSSSPVPSKQNKQDNKKDGRGRFAKAPTPPPMIPPPVPGKRYLPGDVRYKQAMEMEKEMKEQYGQGTSASAYAKNCQPAKETTVKKSYSAFAGIPGSNQKVRDRERPDERRDGERERGRERDRDREKYLDRRHSNEKVDHMRKRDVEREREQLRNKKEKEKLRRLKEEKRRRENMSLLERERERDRERSRRPLRDLDDWDEDEEEDDYDDDSDMDSFIDDTPMEGDDFDPNDFEETLKMVNKKYNKKKWLKRERMISDRDMVADYSSISREEARSARLGRLEDLMEECKGRSERL